MVEEEEEAKKKKKKIKRAKNERMSRRLFANFYTLYPCIDVEKDVGSM